MGVSPFTRYIQVHERVYILIIKYRSGQETAIIELIKGK